MVRVTSFGKLKNIWRDEYCRRLERMIPFQWTEISLKKTPDSRPKALLPEEEKFLEKQSAFVLLDVGGKPFSSDEFARWLFQAPERHLVVGPAIGFHPEFRKRAMDSISLSPLTLTHAMAQAVLAEGLYRSACILKNHPFVK